MANNPYINKVNYGNQTLIDLTVDDVTRADVLSSKKVHLPSGEPTTGTMPNNGAISEVISAKTGTGSSVTIPPGYTSGGSVTLDSTEANKLIPDNIRQNITILGVLGTMSGSEDVRAVAPTVESQITTHRFFPSDFNENPGDDYNYIANFTVNAISYDEQPNDYGGETVKIACYETIPPSSYLDISVEEDNSSMDLLLTVSAGSIEVDWGDETTPDIVNVTRSGQDTHVLSHTYAEAGTPDTDGYPKYTITITPQTNVTSWCLGDSSQTVSDANRKNLFNIAAASPSAQELQPQNIFIINFRGGSKSSIIPVSCFAGTSLRSLNLIDSDITEIGAEAFNKVAYLQEMTLYSPITQIGQDAFSGVTRLKYFVIKEQNTDIPLNYLNIDFSNSKSNPISSTSTASGGGIYQNVGSSLLPLDKVDIPQTITEIKDYAFYNSKNLEQIAIDPEYTTNIGQDAFRYCSNLKRLYIKNYGTDHWANLDFSAADQNPIYYSRSYTTDGIIGDATYTPDDSISIDDTLVIKPYTFSYANNLTGVYIDNYGTQPIDIQHHAFYHADNITSIFIGNGAQTAVTSIGDYAFYGGSEVDLTVPADLYLGEGLLTIGKSAFCDRVLGQVIIPDSVTTLGNYCFQCSSIEYLHIGRNITQTLPGDVFGGFPLFGGTWGTIDYISGSQQNTTYDFVQNCMIEKATHKLVMGSTASIIPDDGSVTSIGQCAFYTNRNLTSITIPSSISSVGTSAFMYCYKLTNINFENGLLSIGNNAFYGCPLSSLFIPESVTSIGTGAFYSASETLESIEVDSNNVTYNSEGNCLIETSTKTLLLGCSKSIIPVDGSVEILGPSCLNGTVFNLLTIPASINTVNDNALSQIEANKFNLVDLSSWCNCSISEYSVNLSKVNHLLIDGVETTHLEIPSGVSHVGEYCFYKCSLIESVSLPASYIFTTETRDYCFQYCSNLKSLELKGSILDYSTTSYYNYYSHVKAILGLASDATSTLGPAVSTVTVSGGSSLNEQAFRNSTELNHIILGANIRGIHSKAFQGCSNLKTLTLNYNGVVTTYSNALTGLPTTCKIYVPAAKVSNYQSNINWNSYSIYPIPT